jgi:hypothetical protein
MRSLLHVLFIGLALMLPAAPARAQGPVPTPEEDLVALQKDVEALRSQAAAAQGADPQDEKLRKQVDLLQKQIEVQQKMIQLLVEHVKTRPLAGTPMEKLQTQVATLDARSQQAARRDQDTVQAIDNLTEHLDAQERNGPRLPATLKELFLPSRTNETPLSIYGQLVAGYELFPHQRGVGRFTFDEIAPVFLLQLNDHILLESELEFHLDGVAVSYAQMDYIVNDCLTVVAGRYLAPVGFFAERLHPAWINKLPDFPLVERQVTPGDFSLNGVQLRGAKYLCCSPVKMEYSLFAANGLGVPAVNDLTGLADLGALTDTTKAANDAIAWGGRAGFWVPEVGLNFGFSGFFNRPFGGEAGPYIDLFGVDAGFHKGDWDVRFEYANVLQKGPVLPQPAMSQAPAGGGDMGAGDQGSMPPEVPMPMRIRRRGFYFQVAYRPYDACNRFLQNTEFVFRYSRARFSGIDPTALNLTRFESPVAAPVDRDQYTSGINYYFYPSLVLKFAYEINQERHLDLRDNVFLAQLAWGF